MRFRRWQFRTRKSSDITSSGTSRRILAGHQPLHELQPLRAAPAPALAPAPAPAPGLATPAVPLLWLSSVIGQRNLARLSTAGQGSSSHEVQGGGVQPVTHHVALRQELTHYRGQNVKEDVCGFSLPEFWLRKSEPTLAEGIGELVAPPDLPHLALGSKRPVAKRSATFLRCSF